MKHDVNSRVVFVAYGSFGDIYPLLGIAVQLKNEGQRVLFVANEYFGESIRRAGVEFVAAGTREEQLAARETATSTGETVEGGMLRYNYLIGANYGRVGRIIEQLFQTGEQLLVVTHGYLSCAFPICERLGIPVAITYLAPTQIPNNREDYVLYQTAFFNDSEWFARRIRFPLSLLWAQTQRAFVNRYNELRAQEGYPRTQGWFRLMWRNLVQGRGITLRNHHPNVVLELGLFPQWFAEPVGDDIEHVENVGFVFHADENESNNRYVENFIAEHGAPIVFTPGTAVEDAKEFCGVIAEICSMLHAPAILLSRYVDVAIKESGLDKTSVPLLALDHVDLGYVLPKARLLIHHGGIGTLAQAVRAGIPQIIRPRMYDQPYNALRVMLNGIGGMVYGQGYTAQQIADVYQHIASSELHSQHLAYYGEQVRKENGARNAAQRILDCLRSLRSPAQSEAQQALVEQAS